jgi:geranylgeranyl diphosphate synthase type II
LSTPSTPTSPPVYPDHLRVEVEAFLEAIRFSEEHATAGLEEAMRYSLLAGGERHHRLPGASDRFGGSERKHRSDALAAALELIHTYSLIHDDLPAMDDDDLRRGRLTCHKMFGDDVAILAGDALYAEAFKLLLSEQEGDPRAVLRAAARLAGATGVQGMVGGQYIDVTETAGAGDDGLRRLHELKTGELISVSIECVLLLFADSPPEVMRAFCDFAGELGVLFQIVDDILDVTGSEETLGKQQGADVRLGKRTYVTEFGLQGARTLAEQSRGRALTALTQAAPAGAAALEQITDFIANRSY